MTLTNANLPRPFLDEEKNTFWDMLEKAHYEHTVPTYKRPIRPRDRSDSLVDVALRTERGLLDYKQYELAELKKFVKSRRLLQDRGNGRGNFSRPTLIKILRDADDNPSFPRFLELPPELRNRIYSVSLQDINYSAGCADNMATLPAVVHQAPITCVSKLLRQEALLLYYSLASFPLMMLTNAGMPAVLDGSTPMTADWDPGTQRWLAGTSDEQFSHITRLHLSLWRPGAMHNFRLYVNLEADLEGGVGAELVSKPGGLFSSYGFWVRRAARINVAVTGVLDGVRARPGVRKLRKTDIRALLFAIRGVLA